MTINFTGLIKVDQGCYRNTDAIKGFGALENGGTRIHYIDGKTQEVSTDTKSLVKAFELSKATGKTLDATDAEKFEKSLLLDINV